MTTISGKAVMKPCAASAIAARPTAGAPPLIVSEPPTEKHAATLDAFAPLEPACAILTKWDETRIPGEALAILIEQGLALSHVTFGQNVPDDIAEVDAGTIAAEAFGLADQPAEAHA